MKKIIVFVLVFGFSLLNASGLFASEKKSKTVIFDVNMDCHACVKKIENNIAYEKGVMDMNVSLEKKEIEIVFRTDKTTEQKLIEAFKKIGYTAKPKDQKDKKMEEKD
jgi:periplasmic mercuric ion binding protein